MQYDVPVLLPEGEFFGGEHSVRRIGRRSRLGVAGERSIQAVSQVRINGAPILLQYPLLKLLERWIATVEILKRFLQTKL
jgi:hypothetical protein